jgi:hypothetical protein
VEGLGSSCSISFSPSIDHKWIELSGLKLRRLEV